MGSVSLAKILLFIFLVICFYVSFTASVYIAPLVSDGTPTGGPLYRFVYQYVPFIAFIFVIISAMVYSRKSFWNGVILGTCTVVLWPIQAMYYFLYDSFVGKDIGILPVFIVLVVGAAFVLSAVTSGLAYWVRTITQRARRKSQSSK